MNVLEHADRVYAALLDRLAPPVLPKIERAYITIGDVDYATRCSQFVVVARQVYTGRPGAPTPTPISPAGQFYEQSVELGISYSDCWPLASGVLPATKENDAGRDLLGRCDKVLTAIDEAWAAGDLVGSCSEATLGPAVFVGPAGGIAGVTVLIALQVN